jgi:NADPH:quinone reductase-like Zn-dependent oxidoreductase
VAGVISEGVEAGGRNVTQFKPGDEVFACPGAFAECACTRESDLAMKPHNVSFEGAASVPAAGLILIADCRLACIRSINWKSAIGNVRYVRCADR